MSNELNTALKTTTINHNVKEDGRYLWKGQ
jgi:hypothetical protein